MKRKKPTDFEIFLAGHYTLEYILEKWRPEQDNIFRGQIKWVNEKANNLAGKEVYEKDELHTRSQRSTNVMVTRVLLNDNCIKDGRAGRYFSKEEKECRIDNYCGGERLVQPYAGVELIVNEHYMINFSMEKWTDKERPTKGYVKQVYQKMNELAEKGIYAPELLSKKTYAGCICAIDKIFDADLIESGKLSKYIKNSATSKHIEANNLKEITGKPNRVLYTKTNRPAIEEAVEEKQEQTKKLKEYRAKGIFEGEGIRIPYSIRFGLNAETGKNIINNVMSLLATYKTK